MHNFYCGLLQSFHGGHIIILICEFNLCFCSETCWNSYLTAFVLFYPLLRIVLCVWFILDAEFLFKLFLYKPLKFQKCKES